MATIKPVSELLTHDTVPKLERAALQRFETAEILRREGRLLAALYLYGYSAEICLAAAFFRSSGFSARTLIDRDTRQRRMAQARQLRLANGEPMMNSDPHPLVGWARFVQYQRQLRGGLSPLQEERLTEAIRQATIIYRHWRPELRYKTIQIAPEQLQEVQRAAKWLIEHQTQL